MEVTPGASGGDPFYLPYDPDCNGEGWRYDDEASPTIIEQCTLSCEGVKLDFGAKVKIVLGCDTIIK